ncbi:DUF4202 domain-containing protein [Lutimonas sp.]|uniref:DUF4202 domain-containing protein n=1 Tax=Lutimonas sp. TaxID=1872403 RepID=UPI003D9BF377
MKKSEKFNAAIDLFDRANAEDPNREIFEGKEYAKELLYAQRMTDRLAIFSPDTDEALQLAVRCQHIRRWEIPRDQYDMNRVGYLKWRNDLKVFHAEKAGEIMHEVGYDDQIIEAVKFLLLKKQLKKNDLTQKLEDVICLVFLEYYFEKFSEKYSEDKMIDILRKTWKKMSSKGQEAALELDYSDHSKALITKALA